MLALKRILEGEEAHMDLSALTETERDAILAVLERDQMLRKQDKQRVYRLKTELSWLRRRGAVRADEDEGAASRTCGRCRAELGLIINRGAPCRACRQRVCKQCREYSVNGRDWVCTVCQKQIDIQLATGEWMNEFVRRPSRRRESKVYVPPADVVKRSLIKRSWTISRTDLREDGTRDPKRLPCPPTGDRTSPELRAHSGRPVPTPRKAPRGHYAPADENEPPWDAPQYPPRAAPPRRYSMSSFDGVPPSSRHLKGPAPAPPRAHYHDTRERSPQSPFGHHSPLGHHSPQRYSSPESPPVPQRRRVLPDLPPHSGPGPLGTPERPSTLPRKLREPRHSSRQSPPAQLDPNRFHSMPRTRTRSPSGQGRGRSEPAHRPQSPVLPLRENPALGGYISSGPVTSTPIMHDPGLVQHRLGTREAPPTPAPRDLSRPPAPGRPPEQGTPNSSLRRHPHVTSGGPRLARSDADLGSLGRLNRSDVEGVSLSRSRTEVDATPVINNRIPASRADSGVSGSSRGGTSDNSDYDMDPSNPFKKMPGPRGRPGGNPTTVNSDESTGSLDEGVGQKSASPSPLVGSAGRISGRESVASLASSTDNSTATHPDEDIERLLQINERKRNSLTPLGSSLGLKTKSLGNLSRSESMASVCSAGAEGRYGTVVVKGEIELGLQYNYKEGQLEVRVVQCRDLAAVDTKRNRSDPYVKVYLLPDKSKSGKRKTKVKKHTLNPSFDEVLRFTTTMSELDSRTLWVSVWHSDMFGRNDFLGEVIIPLADTVFDDVTPKWYPLQEKTEPMDDLSYSPRGDLILALKFVPPDAVTGRKARRSRGALHVLVKEAKSLAAIRPHGTADPICKGLLLPEKGKASKQKTSVCRKTLNPTWNHTLVFEDTSLQELTERSLELSVWDHDRLGTSQFLGGCRLNLGKGKHGGRAVEWMEAAGMEVKLWEQMLERPNLWVEGSIMLRPSMDKPIYSSSMTE